MAFVVVSGDVSGDDIIAWSRNEMANYKVPRVVEIVDALPLNATGKVLKDVLRDRVRPPARARRRRVTAADAADGPSSLTGLRVVEMGVWVAAPSAGALLADWGADVIKVEPPNGDPMRNAFGSLGIGAGLPEPRLRAGQPGQAQRRARPAPAGGPGAAGGAAGDGRRLPDQPAPRRARRPRPRAGGHASPAIRASSTAASAGTACAARTATARPTTSAPSGPARACPCSWPTARASRSTPAAASGTTSAASPPWPASWPRCSSSARPGAAASSRSRCCGPGPTCSGWDLSLQENRRQGGQGRGAAVEPDAADELLPDEGRPLVLLHRPRGGPPHRHRATARSAGRTCAPTPASPMPRRSARTAPRSSPSSTTSSPPSAPRRVGRALRRARASGGRPPRGRPTCWTTPSWPPTTAFLELPTTSDEADGTDAALDQRPGQLLGRPRCAARRRRASASTPRRCWPSLPSGGQRGTSRLRPDRAPGPAGPGR